MCRARQSPGGVICELVSEAVGLRSAKLANESQRPTHCQTQAQDIYARLEEDSYISG
jgi:hypothetical protein